MIRACSLPAAVSPLQLSSIQLAAVNVTDGVSGMPAVVHLLCSMQGAHSRPAAVSCCPYLWHVSCSPASGAVGLVLGVALQWTPAIRCTALDWTQPLTCAWRWP